MRAMTIVCFLFLSLVSLRAQEGGKPIRVGVITAINELTNAVRPAGSEVSIGPFLDWQFAAGRSMVFEVQEFANFSNDDTSNTFFGWRLDVSQFNILYKQEFGKNLSLSGGFGWARVKETLRASESGYFPPHPLSDGRFEPTNNGPGIMAGLHVRLNPRFELLTRVYAYLGDLETLGARGPAIQADEGKPVIVSAGLRFSFTR